MFKESCITEQTQYFFDNDERSYSGVLDCGNCSRYVSVSSCYCMCTNLCVLPFLWLRPLVLCAIKYIPPSHCIFFLDILLFNGLQGWVQNRISFLASFCFPSWFQAAVFWWLPIRHRLPWSVSDQNCRGKNKSPFICFFSLFVCFFDLLSGYTSNSLIHTFTDHCTFTLL